MQIPGFDMFKRANSSLIEQSNDESVMTTEMRRLARNIRYSRYTTDGSSADGRIPRVQTVLFTSAQAHEGKSFITGLLGITIAKDEAAKKVLVIDGDLRRPRQHELFMKPFSPGMSNVLRDGCPLGEAIQPTELPNLFLLPCGDSTGSPERLLGEKTTHDLLNACRDFFDIILVDAPPIIPVNDAAILACHTDGVVLVIMPNGPYGRK